MRIEAVIFDLGGTLLEYSGGYDSWPELEAPGFGAAHEHLSGAGIKLPNLDEFQRAGFDLLPRRWQMATSGVRNLTVPSLLNELILSFNSTLPSDELVYEAASKYQAAVCAGVTPLPHGFQTISTLKRRGYKLALVSNTMFSGAMHIADLKKFDMDSFFEAMVFSSDVNKWKPDPAPFQHVLEIVDLDPSRAVFVGDDPGADVVGGQRAGLFTIHYPSSQRFSYPDGFNPDATISGLNELPSLMNRLNGSAGHDTLATP
jgi:HAD superfamily hydrolase (TIGR01509 family)